MQSLSIFRNTRVHEISDLLIILMAHHAIKVLSELDRGWSIWPRLCSTTHGLPRVSAGGVTPSQGQVVLFKALIKCSGHKANLKWEKKKEKKRAHLYNSGDWSEVIITMISLMESLALLCVTMATLMEAKSDDAGTFCIHGNKRSHPDEMFTMTASNINGHSSSLFTG